LYIYYWISAIYEEIHIKTAKKCIKNERILVTFREGRMVKTVVMAGWAAAGRNCDWFGSGHLKQQPGEFATGLAAAI
jgi:hypothetical protein